MAGTKEGARKAVKTKLEKDKDVFKRNGRKGGEARNKSDKRFTPFSDPEFASAMGKKAARKRWSAEQE